MAHCTGELLENGIHHLIFHQATRRAVEEFATYGMMVLDKRSSDEEKVMFLIDISKSGLPPVRYSVESLRKVWKERSSKNVFVAYLHSKSLVISLFLPVLEALRLQTNRRLFSIEDQERAIQWLLEEEGSATHATNAPVEENTVISNEPNEDEENEMAVEIGHIQAIYRYPVKSMAGESLETSQLGWHGLEGDRRFAFRRVAIKTGFPWLTAGTLPALLQYKPIYEETTQEADGFPSHIKTPKGDVFGLTSDELRDEIIEQHGAEVEMMQLKQGIFDETAISVMALATSHKITSDSGLPDDIRRFRQNIIIDTHTDEPFAEDQWVGKTVIFGDKEDSPAIQITMRDERCAMVNLNPDTVESSPTVLKTVVQLNENCAGVYATVIRTGTLEVGQTVYLK